MSSVDLPMMIEELLSEMAIFEDVHTLGKVPRQVLNYFDVHEQCIYRQYSEIAKICLEGFITTEMLTVKKTGFHSLKTDNICMVYDMNGYKHIKSSINGVVLTGGTSFPSSQNKYFFYEMWEEMNVEVMSVSEGAYEIESFDIEHIRSHFLKTIFIFGVVVAGLESDLFILDSSNFHEI